MVLITYVTKAMIGPGCLDGDTDNAFKSSHISVRVIAPCSERKVCIKNPNGGKCLYYTYTSLALAATDKWSVTTILNTLVVDLVDIYYAGSTNNLDFDTWKFIAFRI